MPPDARIGLERLYSSFDRLGRPEIRVDSMPQMSKLVQSRDEWRNKANKRADEIREHRKTNKRHRETIAELKLQVKELEQKLEASKKM